MVSILRLAPAFNSSPFSKSSLQCIEIYASVTPQAIHLNFHLSCISREFLFSSLSRVTRGVSWGGAEVLIAPRGRIFDLWVTEKFAYKYPSICTKLYHQTFLVILHSKIWLQFLIIFFQDEVLVLQLAECWISEMWTCSLRGVVCLCGGGEVKLWI